VAEATLERSVGFRATHHYHRTEWSAEKNRATFGPLEAPHPHDWVVTVRVRGPLDAYGFVLDLSVLDRLLGDILGVLDGADLNQAIPEMVSGYLQPSTEALARWVWEQLAAHIPEPACLVRVRVAEGAGLAAEYDG
jgi:6-pyruvoyltetrahydropterin/6-carboxytetrahydropterin synthase